VQIEMKGPEFGTPIVKDVQEFGTMNVTITFQTWGEIGEELLVKAVELLDTKGANKLKVRTTSSVKTRYHVGFVSDDLPY